MRPATPWLQGRARAATRPAGELLALPDAGGPCGAQPEGRQAAHVAFGAGLAPLHPSIPLSCASSPFGRKARTGWRAARQANCRHRQALAVHAAPGLGPPAARPCRIRRRPRALVPWPRTTQPGRCRRADHPAQAAVPRSASPALPHHHAARPSGRPAGRARHITAIRLLATQPPAARVPHLAPRSRTAMRTHRPRDPPFSRPFLAQGLRRSAEFGDRTG